MAGKVYLGVSDIAKNVSSIYVGVGDTARRITKAYVGINGIARPFASSSSSASSVTYYGTAPEPLSQPRYNVMAASIGIYALFAGGTYYDSETASEKPSAVVDAYSAFLARSTPTALTYKSDAGAAATVGNYALFSCASPESSSAGISAYDGSLTRSHTSMPFLRKCAAASNGKYAIFIGGINGMTAQQSSMYAYDETLARSSPSTNLPSNSSMTGVRVGDYAIFAGPVANSTTGDAYFAYDHNLARTAITASERRISKVAAASAGSTAVFAGGMKRYGGMSELVEGITSSLVRLTPTTLPYPSTYLSATSLGKNAIFGGDFVDSENGRLACSFDASLNRTDICNMSVLHRYCGATNIGDYAIFAGGLNGDSITDVADVFTLG